MVSLWLNARGSKHLLSINNMNSDNKIKSFIEVLIPVTQCNIKCHYCYVIQRENRTNHKADLPSSEIIRKALSKERLNGLSYISLCGAGETMLVQQLPEITTELLREGHFVNITTNGTISKAFDKFEELSGVNPELMDHLNFSFSLHHLELIRTKSYDKFWANIERCKKMGCSFVVQINLCDEYEPFLDEIKEACIKHVGAAPQVAATRDEKDVTNDIVLYTKHSKEDYVKSGAIMESPLFDYTMKNFMVKRKEFCYAGRLSYVLNLSTGIMKPCYCSFNYQNIYEDLEKPIKLYPVGKHCQSPFCMNSSHFMSFGVIPDFRDNPSYADLRNRKCIDGTEWYQPAFKEMASQKLCENVDLKLSMNDRLHVEYYGLKSYMVRVISHILPKKTVSNIKKLIRK